MMNNMRNLMMACVMMMASICVAMARQETNGEGRRKRPNMEQFTRAQANRIARQLDLDNATAKRFVEAFCNCRREIAATRIPHPTKRPEDMTDAEVERGIKARFQQSRRILYIREKYFKIYSKFLTPKQIQKVYDFEMSDFQHFQKRVFKNGGKELPKPF